MNNNLTAVTIAAALGLAPEPDESDGPDREPEDWHDELVGTRTHACGCTQEYFNCNMEDMPAAEEICRDCKPCPACGERYAECSCPVSEADFLDPFESEEQAKERMTPAEAEADRQWVRPEGRCGVCGEDLQPSERTVCDFCAEVQRREYAR